MADLVPRHVDRRFHHLAYLDRAGLTFVGARKRLQFSDNLANPVSSFARLAKRGLELREPRRESRIALGGDRDRGDLLGDEAEVGDDVGERVVDLVGDAGGECTDGGHAIGEHQPRLQLLAFGHVARHRQHRRLPLEHHQASDELRGDDIAVLAHQALLPRRARCAIIGDRLEARRDALAILGVSDAPHRPAKEILGALVTEVRQRRGVDEDDQPTAVDDDVIGKVLDQQSKIRVRCVTQSPTPR